MRRDRPLALACPGEQVITGAEQTPDFPWALQRRLPGPSGCRQRRVRSGLGADGKKKGILRRSG